MEAGALQERFAAALLDASLPVPASLTTAGCGSAAERFAVYRNNAAVGLRKALAGNFPVVARLVGEDFFAVLARAYAGVRRPSSPLLFTWGEDFSDFLAGFEPAGAVPYLADIARLEFARLAAYHAADIQALGLPALAGLGPDRLAAARLRPHPAARLVASRFPIAGIWLAHQGEAVGNVAGRGPERVLVTRPDLDVRVTLLGRGELAFAQALLAGAGIGEAAIDAAADADFDFGRAAVVLTTAGAFSDILPSSTEIAT